jgi:hypothetical protein
MDSSSSQRCHNAPTAIKRRKEESDMNSNVIGLDLAKNIFHLYGIQADGKVLKKKLRRHELLSFIANIPAG